jgi:AcrR family transcriptional regulator
MMNPVDEVVALDGRPLGRRGALTRRKMLDATGQLLEDHGIRDLRVVDVARAVGSSPATFYQYFRDVEDAVLALAAEVGEDLAPLGETLAKPWDGPPGLIEARALVIDFTQYWDDHRAVLRTRNLAAQEGDRRFRSVRNRSLIPLTEAFAEKISAAQAGGAVDPELSAVAAASALVSMLERMAAFHLDLAPLGASSDEVIETTARLLFHIVTGQ